jgi:carbonic anhydrase
MCVHLERSALSRRRFLARSSSFVGAVGAGAAIGAAGIGLSLPSRPVRAEAATSPILSSQQALDELMAGNARYVSGQSAARGFSAEKAALAAGQAPHSIVLGCADSRVAPELAFDQQLGQLFVVRVAGNTLDASGLASIEYAVKFLGASLIMVLGHSACGAVGAAIKVIKDNAHLPGHLSQLIEPIVPAVKAVKGMGGDTLTDAIKENVRLNVARMRRAGPIVSADIADGRVQAVGGFYDLATGRVELVT